uniref:Uncharacterized protein n=1 Tax=Parascaris equorum TaxID=6256 RepID=A0A914S962_PAREQ
MYAGGEVRKNDLSNLLCEQYFQKLSVRVSPDLDVVGRAIRSIARSLSAPIYHACNISATFVGTTITAPAGVSSHIGHSSTLHSA